MQTEDKIILAGAGLIAAYFLWQKFSTPEKVTAAEAQDLVIKAAEARSDSRTWFAPLQQKQAIAVTNADGSNTTYFLDENDYNSMARWQRALFSWDTPLSWIF
jgi:hypothetical protein